MVIIEGGFTGEVLNIMYMPNLKFYRIRYIKVQSIVSSLLTSEPNLEALLGVIGIRDIWVKNYRDTGYLGGKLKGYGIFLKRFWDIEVIIF